ncbi:MAG TPA: zinc ribbon domain-containing protein [Burkholderiales bacterium]|nr:zinc ribbon domain-containing protein [Burkholderiales bacterium]
MPIYEYRCAKCGYQKEYLQRLSDAPLTKCPECGKKTFNKMVTAAGFQLKGTGWYATDFKNSGGKGKTKEKSGDGAKESSAKESSAKESSAKESTSKESSAKDSATKESSKPESKSAASASQAGS